MDGQLVHDIIQGEGGEQGCPLMPALFALALHDSLKAADDALCADEHIMAFLDDIYIVTSCARAATAFQSVAESIRNGTGIHTHMGKLQMWSKGGGSAPDGVEAGGRDGERR